MLNLNERRFAVQDLTTQPELLSRSFPSFSLIALVAVDHRRAVERLALVDGHSKYAYVVKIFPTRDSTG